MIKTTPAQLLVLMVHSIFCICVFIGAAGEGAGQRLYVKQIIQYFHWLNSLSWNLSEEIVLLLFFCKYLSQIVVENCLLVNALCK